MESNNPPPNVPEEPPILNKPDSKPPHSFDKEHYNHLINTIKWILGISGGAITLIVTVALWSTWQDRKEYRNEVKESLTEAKNDLKDAKAEYLSSLKDIKLQASTEVDKLQNQMTDQVPVIRQNAENLAMSTVQKRLNEEFESKNIQGLINKVAEAVYSCHEDPSFLFMKTHHSCHGDPPNSKQFR